MAVPAPSVCPFAWVTDAGAGQLRVKCRPRGSMSLLSARRSFPARPGSDSSIALRYFASKPRMRNRCLSPSAHVKADVISDQRPPAGPVCAWNFGLSCTGILLTAPSAVICKPKAVGQRPRGRRVCPRPEAIRRQPSAVSRGTFGLSLCIRSPASAGHHRASPGGHEYSAPELAGPADAEFLHPKRLSGRESANLHAEANPLPIANYLALALVRHDNRVAKGRRLTRRDELAAVPRSGSLSERQGSAPYALT